MGGRGSRSKIFRERIALEDALNEHKSTYMHEVLTKAIELALNGNVHMIKFLLETAMSKASPVEDVTEGKEQIRVTIQKLFVDGETTISPPKDEEETTINEEVKLNG